MAEPGTLAVRVRTAYWSVLLLLLGFGLLRLTLFGNALEGVALLVVTLPGGLALLGLGGPMVRAFHLGSSVGWTAYSAFHVYKLVHDPVSMDWFIYVGSGGCAALVLMLCAIHFVATADLTALHSCVGAISGPLLPQHVGDSTLPEPEAGSEPLVWPPTNPHNTMPASHVQRSDSEEQFAASTPAAVWPPPSYTG
ncbi:hypothetical protein T492DRAFT_939045 [Pavlovales sp. CCMP2436]|nr:hypothetical protein T492DRAFT_939045 [Pavlovales sp. CCMP2436]